jgi:Ca2+-binding RTX toxin-like protein
VPEVEPWGRVMRIGKHCGALIGAGLLVVGLSPAAGAGEAPLCFGKPATIVGTEGNDTLTGTPGPDVIHGKDGRDFIDGLGGNDRICGGDNPQPGDDYEELRGGAGNDLINGGLGKHLEQIEGGPGHDLLRGALAAIGGPGDDRVIGPREPDEGGGFEGGQYIGDEGDDILRAFADDYFDAGEGDDLVQAGSRHDLIVAGPGNDRVRAGSGDDTFFDEDGGRGADVYDGGKDRDSWYLRTSNDMSINLQRERSTGAGQDRLISIQDIAITGPGDDRIIGDAAFNYFVTQGGDDVMKGMGGKDRLNGFESSGVGPDRLFGGPGHDDIDGSNGVDKIEGGEGNDHIRGGGQNDTLAGQAGDDFLNGQEGTDDNFGGPGQDTCLSPGPGEPRAHDCEL